MKKHILICCWCGKNFMHKDGRQMNCSPKCFKESHSKKFLGVPQKTGKQSSAWKGDNIGYMRIHSWLRENYGSADKCENKDCPYKNPKRFEWALKKEKSYLRRRSYFKKLCCGCHRKYDDTIIRGWKTKKNKHAT